MSDFSLNSCLTNLYRRKVSSFQCTSCHCRSHCVSGVFRPEKPLLWKQSPCTHQRTCRHPMLSFEECDARRRQDFALHEPLGAYHMLRQAFPVQKSSWRTNVKQSLTLRWLPRVKLSHTQDRCCSSQARDTRQIWVLNAKTKWRARSYWHNARTSADLAKHRPDHRNKQRYFACCWKKALLR